MTGIFINYRRDDSGSYAKQIYNYLASHFGENDVFIDVENIPPGADFDREITRVLYGCDFFILVIGPQWLTLKNNQGVRRLDVTDDLVLKEIKTALYQHLDIVPILVDGAHLPNVEELPSLIRDLLKYNAMTLKPRGFKREMNRLVDTIEEVRSGRERNLVALIEAISGLKNDDETSSILGILPF